MFTLLVKRAAELADKGGREDDSLVGNSPSLGRSKSYLLVRRVRRSLTRRAKLRGGRGEIEETCQAS